MLRSEIIKRAQGRILQGDADPMWSVTEWNDLFHRAIDLVWWEIVTTRDDYFIRRKYQIDHGGSGVYRLPEDFYQLMWVQEPSGDPIFEVKTLERERVNMKVGFRLVNDDIVLVNWNEATYPQALLIDYKRYPKEFQSDWAGGDDTPGSNGAPPTVADLSPDPPLDTKRAGRMLADIMAVLAQTKDRTASSDQFALVQRSIQEFVDRLGGRSNIGPSLMGT